MDPLIDIQQLDFAYGQQLVLKQVTLPVCAGSALGIVGPNGGGKTTLLKLLLGQLRPTRGSIRIDGQTPAQAVARGDLIGYLPQNYAINESFPLSARQVATLGLAGKTGPLRCHAPADLAFVDHLLQRVGLGDVADQPVGMLSGGQRQRVLIARALAVRPQILLLDEPMTGIDRLGQQRFIEFLHGLKDELKLTLVLISHDLRAVAALADRIACLNVTLHYHDVPERLPAELVYRLFACDLEAFSPHVRQAPQAAPHSAAV